MSIEKFATRPDGKQVRIPSNIIPEAEQFVSATVERSTPEFSKSEYGHAAMAMAVASLACASNDESPEKQREYFRTCALEMVHKFGERIVPFLRDELRLSLTEEDLLPSNTK